MDLVALCYLVGPQGTTIDSMDNQVHESKLFALSAQRSQV
jgi:hypothetical protein